MYVCMYVCTYICRTGPIHTRVRTYIQMYVHTYILYIRMYVRMNRMYVCMYICKYIHTCIPCTRSSSSVLAWGHSLAVNVTVRGKTVLAFDRPVSCCKVSSSLPMISGMTTDGTKSVILFPTTSCGSRYPKRVAKFSSQAKISLVGGLRVKCALARATGSTTTITLGSSSVLTPFIQTETGNSVPSLLTASIYIQKWTPLIANQEVCVCHW